MRYLFGTGIIGALLSGASLLRGSREEPISWRAVLAWVSWGITLALAIGAVVDLARAERGLPVAEDSPSAERADKEAKKALKKTGRA